MKARVKGEECGADSDWSLDPRSQKRFLRRRNWNQRELALFRLCCERQFQASVGSRVEITSSFLQSRRLWGGNGGKLKVTSSGMMASEEEQSHWGWTLQRAKRQLCLLSPPWVKRRMKPRAPVCAAPVCVPSGHQPS